MLSDKIVYTQSTITIKKASILHMC